MERPDIAAIQSAKELKNWYWLKTELVCLAKNKGVSITGTKFEILDRIIAHLEGEIREDAPKVKVKSTFNWSKEPLSPETRITDSYKNTENVRYFFTKHCGAGFAFNIPFMHWMKQNQGKTLKDALLAWKNMRVLQKDHKSVIPKSNQYNQYIRDFCADNPDKSLKEARNFWKLKRALPMANHAYATTDLTLKSRDIKN